MDSVRDPIIEIPSVTDDSMNDQTASVDTGSAEPSQDSKGIKVQIIGYDSYQSVPSQLDKQYFTINGKQPSSKHQNVGSSRYSQVPMIRIYGKLSTGHTVLLHMHNIFPYIYIEYKGPSTDDEDQVFRYLLELKNEIDKRMQVSFWHKNKRSKKKRKRKTIDADNGSDDDNDDEFESQLGSDDADTDDEFADELKMTGNKYVGDISLVKGIPFYGYHPSYTPFIKISLLSPKYTVRLTRLLHEGKLLGGFKQPFESHVPYTLQFLTDYNCYGSDWIYLDEVYWRGPIVHVDNDDDAYQEFFKTDSCEFNRHKIDDSLKALLRRQLERKGLISLNVLSNQTFPRMGRTLCEIDASGSWILNRHKLKERDIHPNFKEFLTPEQEKMNNDEPYITSTKTLLNDVLYQRKIKNLPPDPTLKLFEDNDRRSYKGTQLIEQEELDELLKYCCDSSKKEWIELHADNELNLESVLKKNVWLSKYPTSFQSVDKLGYIPQVTESNLLPLNEQVLLDESRVVDWVLFGTQVLPSSTISKESSVETSSQNISGQIPSQQSITIRQSIIGTTDNEIEDAASSSNSSAEDETDDDADDFLGSIPHLEVVREVEWQQHPVISLKSLVSPNELDSSLFGEIERHIDNTRKPIPNAKDVESESSEENMDQKLFQMTQHKKGTASITKSDLNLMSERAYHSATFSLPSPTTRKIINHNHKKSQAEHHPLMAFKDGSSKDVLFEVGLNPPIFGSSDLMMQSFETDYGILKMDYLDPFYSNRDNYNEDPFYYAGKKFQLKCLDLKGLKNYSTNQSINSNNLTSLDKMVECNSIWSYSLTPPTLKEVQQWTKVNKPSSRKTKSQLLKSQIDMVTQNLRGHKYQSLQTPVSRKKTDFLKLILLNVEIHVNTRGDLHPDPVIDPITAIFWDFDEDSYPFELGLNKKGIFLFDPVGEKKWLNLTDCPIEVFQDEQDMIAELVSLIEFVDPDILSGYEIHSSSWGYILERFRKYFKIDLSVRLSRVAYQYKNKSADRWGYTHASGIKVTGRHMLNIWRPLRGELALNKYSLENVVFHALHQRIPSYNFKTLTRWFTSDDPKLNLIVLEYFINRSGYVMTLVDRLELVERTSEQSRMLGIDYYSVFYRGSQFKVESLLVRMAKAENFILVSPSKKQVFKQDPLQCVPLILEPESSYYKSPLVVLDFQSLYPSLIIAYNYCYSTLLGRLRGFDAKKYQKIGVANLKLPPGLLKLFEKHINLTPNGLMFLKHDVRKSLLAKMLTELLDARILVKGTMNKLKDDHEINKLYNNRQLALKLIANVTYGYASATFSGRMPNSDIADAIVSSAREALLKAITEIESNEKWGAKVVYGDTDSLFVYLPGKTKEEAFKLGREMASYVTSYNPAPVKLKFEKVYFPSVLLSKKRYVGYAYEYETQKEPKFDAKGIETVRRDGTPAQQKIVEKALRTLFETNDISKVKDYVNLQFSKIMKDKINIKDFLFGKEVRLGTYKNEKYMPPGARLSLQKVYKDHRSEPQYKERVFYMVVKGHKDQILRDRCITPADYLNACETLELDSNYYITKVLIPPLERIFSLMGVDVKQWFAELPKFMKTANLDNLKSRKLIIQSSTCISCNKNAITTKLQSEKKNNLSSKLCDSCLSDELKTCLDIRLKVKAQEEKLSDLIMVCQGCTKRNIKNNNAVLETVNNCVSEDCPIYYDRVKAKGKVNANINKFKDFLNW